MRPAGAAPPPRGRGPGMRLRPAGSRRARVDGAPGSRIFVKTFPRRGLRSQRPVSQGFAKRPLSPRRTAPAGSPNGPHCSSAGALWRYSPARPALRSGMCKDCLRPRRHCRRHRDRAPTGLTRPPFAAPAPRPWPASGAKKRGPVALFPPGQSFFSINSVYLQRKKHKARV